MVSVKKSMEHKFADIGVRDSKLLSRRRRENLYDMIKDITSDVKVSKIYPHEINEAMKGSISLNELEAIHFARLFDKFQGHASVLYLDSPDVIPEKFGMRISILSKKPTRIVGISPKGEKGVQYTRLVSEHKADARYPVVSAASIIAKVERDWEIDRISEAVGMDLGSGYPADMFTISVIKENMKNGLLKQHIRQYWQTMQAIKQTRLANF
jgi:ribonuclease HII